jgi:protein strawberry notch
MTSDRDRLHQLRAIPLESVLATTGARRDCHDRAKWHTVQGTISVTGMKFMNWTQGRGGGGAIDLAMHLNGFDFKAALHWLRCHFPLRDYSESQPPGPPLTLPLPHCSNLCRVKQYLVHHRGITHSLIESLVQSGRLYADTRGNAVFLLLGKENTPVGAELRGTGPARWRGLAPGSQKDLGYFSIDARRATMIVLCESAIDAMSCFLLHPASLCVSTSGARPNPRWLPSLLSQGYPLYCGFDADPAGDAMAQQMVALYPAVRRLRPTQHDWNDVLLYHPLADLPLPTYNP